MGNLAERVLATVKESDKTCPVHGVKLVYNFKANPFCPICQREQIDKEKIKLVKKAQDDEVRHYLQNESKAKKLDYFKCTFDTFVAPKNSPEEAVKLQARKIAYEYLKCPDKPFNTILFGKPGVGKTHLAMAMLNAINEHAQPPVRCLFVNTSKMKREVYAGKFEHATTGWSDTTAIRKIAKANVVVLDDVGTEASLTGDRQANELIQGLMYDITEEQPRIITTTNMISREIEAAYNDKIVSRLFAHSRGHIIDFSQIKDKRI